MIERIIKGNRHRGDDRDLWGGTPSRRRASLVTSLSDGLNGTFQQVCSREGDGAIQGIPE
jgi:hypothetical protein